MIQMFDNCSSLSYIPNISKWRFNKILLRSNMFERCISLIYTPNILENQIQQINENITINENDFNDIFRIIMDGQNQSQKNSRNFNCINYYDFN